MKNSVNWTLVDEKCDTILRYLRNILVHEYTKIDWSILWMVVENHLSDFKDFVVQMRSHQK